MSDHVKIAMLQAKVEALEGLLRRRSGELRLIQAHLDAEGLLVVSRILAGLPPLPRRAHTLDLWQETYQLEAADVEDSMGDLWRSLTPLTDPADPA